MSRKLDKSLLFEGPGTNRSLDLQCRARRRRRGLRQGALYAARDLAHRPPLRPHHGAARRHGRVGRGQGPAHGLGRRQGAVLQPPHPRQADRPAGRRHRHDRERRRRRLRRARRVLSGGFPDPVRGAPSQPAGEMDRGPPREPDGDEPRARGRGRRRDRLRARRHHPGAARPRPRRHGRLYAHQRRGRRAQHRAVHVRAVSHRRTSSSTCRCG